MQYTLPASTLEALPVSSANVYISGNNLHYFTKYEGLTPEIPGSVRSPGSVDDPNNANVNNNSALNAGIDNNIYPVSSFFQLGTSITF